MSAPAVATSPTAAGATMFGTGSAGSSTESPSSSSAAGKGKKKKAKRMPPGLKLRIPPSQLEIDTNLATSSAIQTSQFTDAPAGSLEAGETDEYAEGTLYKYNNAIMIGTPAAIAPVGTPTFATTPTQYDEIHPSEFATWLDELASGVRSEESLLVIDIRSFFIFEKAHIVNAINVSLPRALTGKKETSLERVENLITGVAGKSEFRMRADRTVVVYDDNPDNRGERPANALVKLLLAEGEVTDVFLLEGGFKNFRDLHPELCVTGGDHANGLEDSDDDYLMSPFIVSLGSHSAADLAKIERLQAEYDCDPPSEVLPGLLYLGSDRNANNKASLQRLGIKAILNVAKECPNHHPDDFTYCRIELHDNPDQDLVPYVKDALDFLEGAIERDEPVLVHCYQGISRSSTLTLMYLMQYQGMTLSDAYDYLRSCRNKVCPNTGFMAHLIRFERRLTGTCSLNSDEYAPLLMESYDNEYPPLEIATHARKVPLRDVAITQNSGGQRGGPRGSRSLRNGGGGGGGEGRSSDVTAAATGTPSSSSSGMWTPRETRRRVMQAPTTPKAADAFAFPETPLAGDSAAFPGGSGSGFGSFSMETNGAAAAEAASADVVKPSLGRELEVPVLAVPAKTPKGGEGKGFDF